MTGMAARASLVSITVLSVTPARTNKLFALASVEVDIDGVQIVIHRIRALRVAPVRHPDRVAGVQ